MKKQLILKLLGEKSLSEGVFSDVLSHCPSMDLVVLGTLDQQVQVYRHNGQQVYASNQRKGDVKVECVCWKPSGHLVATAWSDGSVKLVGAESTKTVHQFATADASGITHIGWSKNLTRNVIDLPASFEGSRVWQDALAEASTDSNNRESLNLPRELSQIDIETSLPKLSVLASGGTSEDVFSSRASLDALFKPFDPKDTQAVDVMLVGTREGDLHLSIYDSFVVGTFKSPVRLENTFAQLALHAAHAEYSTHSLLLQVPAEKSRLFFIPMDLRFVSASSEYLSLLASRSSAFQNLLRYIHEVHRLMVAEWEFTRDLPSKFLRNVDEDLKEKDNRDIVQALYHSIATGHTFPIVKEWLVDQVAERGHKRWDKTVTTGLENLKQLIHENMLPALDRCSVILSRFAGIAKFRGSDDVIGFTSQQITLLTDTIACLHLVSSKLLTQVIEELELFVAFSAWLRYEIDRLASEGLSSQDDDAEKESAIDHTKVLLYVQTALRTSPLSNYLGRLSEDDRKSSQMQAEQGEPLFELLNKQVQKMEKGQQYLTYLPQQGHLATLLSTQANRVFAQIAEAEKRNVLFGNTIEIGHVGKGCVMDMTVARYEATVSRTYIALAPKERSGLLQIIRITLSIDRGISSVRAVEASSVQLGTGNIRHVKFYENSILALWNNGDTHFLSIPLESPITSNLPGGGFEMRYVGHDLNKPSTPVTLGNDHVKRLFRCDIPDESSDFTPARLHVRDSATTTGVKDDGRIVLVGQDKMRYKVFAVAAEDEAKDSDGDVVMPESFET